MIKPQFVIGEIYHIYNRGVEKRNVFLKDSDFLRFIYDLSEFNDEGSAIPLKLRQNRYEVEPRTYSRLIIKKPLVDILAFSLMPNHFHLLLREKKEKGIIRFMQKLGTGYTMYFNKKQERVGSLFQGRFKAKLINREEYLEYILYYIHFNCLKLIDPKWSEKMIQDYQKAINQLETYRWSSHLDYIGKRNFPSIIQRDFLLKIIGGEEKYKNTIEEWLKSISQKIEIEEFRNLIIE